ncbi:hypothetical protein OG864_51745 [Streptomyces sp. NBC_00124]|uniref:hypothetical protein n=1 Tax=Streptomyces sp. NBC_00124 TaxID=2975662 RepID=UPI00224F8FCB|nr:hypothetical protein [Streptomyces sp. NBC_00124]MCX5367155.1 hypothetical protein [Streptomyces sp. NBC_00124]
MTSLSGAGVRCARVVVAAGVCAGLLGVLLTGCSAGGSSNSAEPEGSSASAADNAPPSPATTEPTSVPTDSPAIETAASPPVASTADTLPSEPTGASALWGQQYSGTAQVTVDVYDYCSTDGSRRFADTKTYSMNATLDLSRPRTGEGGTETNPFSLLLAVGQPSEAGAVSFWSSAVSTGSSQDLAGNPRDPNLLLTYWELAWDDGELSGRLTDPHTEQAVALNLLNWPSLLVPCRSDLGELPGGYPHAVAEGTTLDGEVEGGSANLTAQGSTGDGQLEFRFDFSGAST